MFSILIYSALLLALDGMKFSLKTTIFCDENMVFGTTIMQKGEKIRIEETFPNSEEISTFAISDGKECWHIWANGKKFEMPPIKDIFEAIGIDKEAIKKDVKIKTAVEDAQTKAIPPQRVVKQQVQQKEIVSYKEYFATENMGQIPAVIETYDSNNKLQRRIEIVNVDEGLNFSDELFNKNAIKFSDKAKEIAKKCKRELFE